MKTTNFTTKESLKKEYALTYANKMQAADAPKLPYSIDWSKEQTLTELKKALKADQTLYKKMKGLKDLKGDVAERIKELAEHLSLAAAKVAEPNLKDSTRTYICFQVEQHLLRTWNKLTYEQRMEADEALAKKTGVPEKMKERDAKKAEQEAKKAAAPKKEQAKKSKSKPEAKPEQSNEAQILQLLQTLVANQQEMGARIEALEQKRSRKTKKEGA